MLEALRNRRQYFVLAVLLLPLVFFVPDFTDPTPAGPDNGVWGGLTTDFPLVYTIKERKYILWTPFQIFEIEDSTERLVGVLSESITSWISEFFGAGYVSLWDGQEHFNANIQFSKLKKYIFWGSRDVFAYDDQGGQMLHGKLQNLFTAMFSGKRRPMYMDCGENITYRSTKTHTKQNHQRWEIRNVNTGELEARLDEFVVRDMWNKEFRGWNVQVFQEESGNHPPHLDPRIPALLAGIDLGSKVLQEETQPAGGQVVHPAPSVQSNRLADLERRIMALEHRLADAGL